MDQNSRTQGVISSIGGEGEGGDRLWQITTVEQNGQEKLKH